MLLACSALLLQGCALPVNHRLVPVRLARVAYYDPALGGINCDHECDYLGDGSPVERMYDHALACPAGWYGRWLFIPQIGWRECRDGGGAIVEHPDGSIVVDVLTRVPINTSARLAYWLSDAPMRLSRAQKGAREHEAE